MTKAHVLPYHSPMGSVLAILLMLLQTDASFAISFDCVQDSERTSHEFMPNCQGTEHLPDGRMIPFRTNALGLRAKDYSARPAKGVLRILFLGPSSAVSFTSDIGLVPSMERSLNELAKKDKRFLRKYKRIEVISAAEAGFTLVHSYIRMSQLLAAYNPHLVMLTQIYSGSALQQVFDHSVSEKDPDTGLARRLPPPQHFWPLPKDMEHKVWQWSRANELRVWVAGVRLALIKWREKLFGGEESVFLRVHKNYLSAIKKRAEEHGAKFIFLTQEALRGNLVESYERSLQFDSWYKPEWIAAKFAPWSHLKDAEAPELREWMEKEFPVVNIAMAVRAGWRPSYGQVNDYHPAPEGAHFLGRTYAHGAYPVIKEVLGLKK